jgi:antitoxin HigA-1
MSTARAIHPGEILREEFLAPLELRMCELATALQVPASYIKDVVRENIGVTPDFAQRLARYFDTAPQFWTDLQARYDAKLARRKSKAHIARPIPLQCEPLRGSGSL